MKVGIYSFYFDTYGGGERYILTLADFFLKKGDGVTVFSGNKLDPISVKDRFQLDLSGVHFDADAFGEGSNLVRRLQTTAGFDLFIFLSNGSIPTTLAGHNFLHFQTPFNFRNQKTLINRVKLGRFAGIICNSYYTKKFIDQTYGVSSRVIYPPVDTDSIRPGKKENVILSVGRFFAQPHDKKQEILIETFGQMIKAGLTGWKLVLFGGVSADKKALVEKMRAKASNLPVEIMLDGSFTDLLKAYGQAKIYWHAAGFGEDLEQFPDRAEHFGMTTVEAMAAGAVPVVFNGGGQKEIIVEGKNGLFWFTEEELMTKTQKLITDGELWTKLCTKARERARDFSKDRFCRQWADLVNF